MVPQTSHFQMVCTPVMWVGAFSVNLYNVTDRDDTFPPSNGLFKELCCAIIFT